MCIYVCVHVCCAIERIDGHGHCNTNNHESSKCKSKGSSNSMSKRRLKCNRNTHNKSGRIKQQRKALHTLVIMFRIILHLRPYATCSVSGLGFRAVQGVRLGVRESPSPKSFHVNKHHSLGFRFRVWSTVHPKS